MAKNAGHTVAALLKKAPPPPRTQVPPVPAVEPEQAQEHAPQVEESGTIWGRQWLTGGVCSRWGVAGWPSASS